MRFLEYELTADTLCLGERVKAGLFRPCDTRTIRYSAITGALRSYLGRDDLHAAGYFVQDGEHNQVDYFTYSPRDRVLGSSKIPLTVQFLRNVLGKIYIPDHADLPEEFDLSLGALKSRGFGQCHLRYLTSLDSEEHRAFGRLNTRIPLDRVDVFAIKEVKVPVYGYLFRPTSRTDGVYVLSLFEGSVVVGPRFLLEEGTK
ncbi:MAG: hypothetical protein H5T64_13155 [Chloroflexi bacterium]|nr:hypothetical protein [Chloroflexota bacterium]